MGDGNPCQALQELDGTAGYRNCDRLDNLFNHSQAVVLSGLKAYFAVQGIEALPFFLQKSIESSDSLLRELGGYRTKRVFP